MGLYFFTRPYTYDTGVTASSSVGNTVTGHPEEDAIDYDKASYWENDAAQPELEIDLGSAKKIDCLWMKSYNVDTLELYYSDNGTAWTKVTDGTAGASGGIDWLFEFTAQTKRYWKVKITAKDAGGENVKMYEVMLMELRLAVTDEDNMPALIHVTPTDRAGGSYTLANGAATSYAGERGLVDIDLRYEMTPKASRDNLYSLFSTPTLRPTLTLFPDSEDYPGDVYRVVWQDTEFGLSYEDGYKGLGFGGRLRLQEY